ncbi:tryptophan synthase subunit alpha [Candidatus Woesearchaeota archaeon]|nr:tryptophan synthase subunit alpha [Candidatus Woesearchaeota archaeon]
MKTYEEVFSELKRKKEGALVAFVVIGDPDYKTSLEIAKKIADSGADILELGIPFSDPIADGKTIQAADVRSLESGMNTDRAFDFVKEFREYTDIPIGFLTYYNLVYQRGIEKFYSDSRKAGVNSVLIADLSIEESADVIKASNKNKVDTVFMVSQLSSDERIKRIASLSNGFIYLVSRLGVTGTRDDLSSSTFSSIKRVRKFTSKPLCIGFGISTLSHVKDVLKAGADGAIVGSAIVDLIGKNTKNKVKMIESIQDYIKNLKDATKIRKK